MQHGPGHRERLRRRRPGLRRFRRRSSSCPAATRARINQYPPNFSAFLNFRNVTKWIEQVTVRPKHVPDIMRRAFTQVRNGRPRPVLVEFPADVMAEDVPEPLRYTPAPQLTRRPRPARRRQSRRGAGRGRTAGHLRRPGRALRQSLGRAAANWPSCSKPRSPPAWKARAPSPKTIRCSSARAAAPYPSRAHLPRSSDVIFGIGCSFATTSFGVRCPRRAGRPSSTPRSIPPTSTRTSRSDYALIGDAQLTLDALIAEVRDRLKKQARGRTAAHRRRDQVDQRRLARAVEAQADLRRHAAQRRIASSGTCCTPSTWPTRSSPTTRAARATSCRRSGNPPSR